MKAGKVFAFAFLIGAVLLATDCVSPDPGPDPGNGNYETYTDPVYGYSFEYPAGWQIMDESAGVVMIASNDAMMSAMITAGVEEKEEYSYTNPYDLVDAMAQGFTSASGAQVDGPYHTTVGGHDAAEVFIFMSMATEGAAMDVEYTMLAIDLGEVFFNFMLTECGSPMCTQYPGVYDHAKDSFSSDGGNGNGGVPNSAFESCQLAASMCANLLENDPTHDCTVMCEEHCYTGDYRDIMTGEDTLDSCEKSNSACGYCNAGDVDSIHQ